MIIEQVKTVFASPVTKTVLAAVVPVIRIVGILITRRKNSKTAKNLRPVFEYNDIVKARKYFIPTKFQNQSPTRQSDPGRDYRVAKTELISDLIKNTFVEERNDKFYLVLADSGMGKTTFMINLYMKYCSVFNFKRKYKIKLVRFGRKDFLNEIGKIKDDDKKDTILLMDAFDEWKGLFEKEKLDMTDDDCFNKKVNEIIDIVQDFFIVLITSRSQYFPGEENNPYDLNVERSDGEGVYTLRKLYLAPFDTNEIKKYLNKKYGYIRLWNIKKKKIAKDIIEKSPNLMVRPMLLSYIDYLTKENRKYECVYDIYERMIEEWIEREAKKRKKRDSRDKFKKDLKKYSQLVALEIYKNRTKKGELILDRNSAINIAEENNIELEGYEITGQSLLTRDANEKWKFAHKSIFEFFIAKDLIENCKYGEYKDLFKSNYYGMDMAKKFLQEKKYGFKNFSFIKGNEFDMGSPRGEYGRTENELLHRVKLSDYYIGKYAVTIEEFKEFVNETNYNFKYDSFADLDKRNPITSVSWKDAKKYCDWLSKKYSIKFRLPTEAEWEYACRAGSNTPFNTGKNLSTDEANYNGKYPYKNNAKGKYLKKVALVGSYKANEFGLYEMHGNVWEWCEDCYGKEYYNECSSKDLVENPTGPAFGDDRVLRGGSWNRRAVNCRSASRRFNYPDLRNDCIGFRVVFVP